MIKPSLKQSRVILDWFIDNEMIEKTPVKRWHNLTIASPSCPEVKGVRADPKESIKTESKGEVRAEVRAYPKIRKKKTLKRRDWTGGGAEVGHYTNNEINKKIYVEGSNELRLATLLLKEIRKNKPDFKQPNLQSWAKEVDLIIRRDDRKPERIQQVIEWCQGDSFWRSNILSTKKLREKFDELEIKMESLKKARVTERPRVEYEDFTGKGQR